MFGIRQAAQWPGPVLKEVVSPGGGRVCALELLLAIMLGWTCSVPRGQKLCQQALSQPSELVRLTHRNFTSIHSVYQHGRETSGARAEPFEFHRCASGQGLRGDIQAMALRGPGRGSGHGACHGELFSQVYGALWITGGGLGAQPKSLVTRSSERNKPCASVEELGLRLRNKVGA